MLVLSYGVSRADHIAALTASSAELSALSRNLHRLNVLLRQADAEAAKHYRDRLSNPAIDVRTHLEVAAHVLADLRPSRSSASTHSHSTR